MSLLLDALRKADRQRRDRSDTAGQANDPPPPARYRAASPGLLLGLVLLLNALAVAGFLYWYTPASTQTPTQTPTQAPATAGTTGPQTPWPPMARGPVRPLRAEAVPPTPGQAADQAPVEAPAGDSGHAGAGVPTGRTPADATPPADSSLARLHVDMHVWSEDPAQRFVLINMQRYREGERLPGGARIVEIRPEGVLVIQGGEHFLLPRR